MIERAEFRRVVGSRAHRSVVASETVKTVEDIWQATPYVRGVISRTLHKEKCLSSFLVYVGARVTDVMSMNDMIAPPSFRQYCMSTPSPNISPGASAAFSQAEASSSSPPSCHAQAICLIPSSRAGLFKID